MKEPIVTTQYGHVRGTVENNINGGTYFAFKGIPYAKPPIGELRFSDPLPPEPWTGVRDATEHGENCAQRNRVMRNIGGSEDCLYLNMYTSIINVTDLRPVMVWIHGGAFMFGSGDSDLFSPDYFMEHDVVIVTFNYRLGVLGFLNLEDEVAPGNQGLKDQVLALRWVQKNISSFGGDPKNVTVFGNSAGAASVHYLALSPLARGLFHKAIAQSGVVLNPWAFMPKYPVRYAFQLCEILGEKSSDPRTVVNFLRQVNFKDLIEAQEKILTTREKHQVLYPFGPGVDVKSINPFLTENPWVAAQSLVRVPFLIGYNDMEGSLLVAGKTEQHFKLIDLFFAEMLHPSTSMILFQNNVDVQNLKRYYFKEEPVSLKNTEKYAKMCTDIYFRHGIIEVCKLQARSPFPTYSYKFTYNKDPTLIKQIFSLYDIPGAAHTDELDYLFHQPLRTAIGIDPPKRDSTGYRLIQRMTTMWTNFAKTGNPTPMRSEMIPIIWKPIEHSILNYLHIDEDLRMESLPIKYDIFHEMRQQTSKL